MALSKKAKIWLIVLAIPVVLVVAGIVVLKMMFTSERLKAEVIPRMEEATGRSVSISDVSLGVFPSIALNMDSVRISNRVGEGFSDAPFLTLDGLRVNVKLFPLFGGRVEATSLELDRPNILIEINQKFDTNYEDLIGETDTPPGDSPTEEASPSAALALLVSGFRVNDGTMEYLNRADNSATRLYGVEIDADVAVEEGRILVTGDASTENFSYGTIETPMVEGLRMSLRHRIAYNMAADVATFEEGDLMVQNIPLMLAGTMSDLRDSTMLDLTVGSDNVNIADLMSLVPGEYREQAESVKGTGTAQIQIKIKGTLYRSAKPDITGTIRATGASVQYADLPNPITNINITSDFYRSTRRQEFHVEKLTANLGESPISMAMRVVDFEDPALNLTANTSLDLATVKDYYPLEEGTELAGRMKADIRLNGKVSNPEAMKAAGTMEFDNVTAKTPSSKHPVRNLNGTVRFSNEVLDSRKLSMNLGRSDMSVAFRLVNYLSVISDDEKAPRARADLTLQSNQLFVDDIMSDDEEAAGGAGTPGGPAEKSGLPLPGVDMNLNANIGTLTTEKFVFKNVRGRMTIANGIINMQNLTCNTLGGSVNAKGTLNMQTPDRPLFDLALGLNALQANSLLSSFSSFGQRITGSMTMNTTLKGALDDTLGLIPAALG
ncbi:MAG: AsmA family protein, partial [Bacteroidota bacterium]